MPNSAEGGGNLVDHLHPHALDADLGGTVVRDGVRGDRGAFQRKDLLLHDDVQDAVVPDLEQEAHVVQRIAAQADRVVADGQGQAVEAGGVRDRVRARLLVVDRHADERLSARDVADVSADVDLAVAVGRVVADLIDLVLEGHDGVLLRQVALQPAVVAQFLAGVEIAGGQGSVDGLAVQDEAGGAVVADGIALFAQGVECGVEELRPRRAHAERGLLGGVLDVIDLLPEFFAQEIDERVQSDALDLHGSLCGQGAQAGGSQQDAEKYLFHRLVRLRMSRQASSNLFRP